MTPCNLVRPSILNGVTFLIKIPARSPHLVDIMTRLRAELSTIRIPVGAIYLSLPKNVQTGSGAHPASHVMDIGGLSIEKISRGMKLTTHLQLVPRLTMRGAIPLHPLYAFMAWTAITSSFLPIFICLLSKFIK